mmetsp:Transcript_75758/g.215811  ORF Transcript_75758/g.215811 Transcript_75758/m.215811 type:complete len:520 (-) Transcript_75758:261-1820(-)
MIAWRWLFCALLVVVEPCDASVVGERTWRRRLFESEDDFDDDESDVVSTNPPDESELQPGRVLSDENVYINFDGTGNFRTHCEESHVNNDDPLVYPGQTGAAHEHVFFGFPTTDAFTSIGTLENSTNVTTCEGKALNQAAYWVPSLFTADGTRLENKETLFYYKSGYHIPADTIEVPPQGLVMIAGNDLSEPQDVVSAKYRCTSWEAPEPQFDEGDPMDHVPYLPECQPGDMLEFRVVFPQCWDGLNLTSGDQRSHMAYPIPAEAPNIGTGWCPDSHPVAIPEISYKFEFEISSSMGSSDTWYLSSDLDPSQPRGSSLHADWMNGWDPDIMDLIVKNCINTGYDCSVGLLGDGTRLEEVHGADLCSDDSSWGHKGKSSKDCDWVAKKPHKYCKKDDGDNWLALDACQETCGTCGCEDAGEDKWLYKGRSGRGCDYVSKKPSKYCDYEDNDGTTAAEACPMTCGNCGCQDSLTWRHKGKSSKDCEWVAKKPNKYCSSKYKDDDGTKAKHACRVTCETCDD